MIMGNGQLHATKYPTFCLFMLCLRTPSLNVKLAFCYTLICILISYGSCHHLISVNILQKKFLYILPPPTHPSIQAHLLAVYRKYLLSCTIVELHIIQCGPVPGPILLHNLFAQAIKPISAIIPCGDRSV